MSPTRVVLVALAAIVVVVDIPPLIWHFKNRNIALFSLLLWLIILNLVTVTNALIWPTDDTSTWWDGQGLCDIQVRLLLAADYALSGSLVCIMQGLAKVMDTDRAVINQSRHDRIKKTTLDLTLCFGLPAALSILHLAIDQPARYVILTVSGCTVPISYNWVTLVLIWLVPVLITSVASFYALTVMYRMYRYRRQFSALLERSRTTKARFIRLFAMTQVLLTITLPLQLYSLSANLAMVQLEPYSWSVIHDHWSSTIILVPMDGVIDPTIWVRVVAGLLAFLFFGTGAEAITRYRGWLILLGLGKLFPSLLQQHSSITSNPSRVTISSVGSKAKFWTSWRARKGSASTEASATNISLFQRSLTTSTRVTDCPQMQTLDNIYITRGSLMFDIDPDLEAQDDGDDSTHEPRPRL
ncbi:STE3-domain-containing protein [Pseudovirgaria hyperparasitica]|uniref:STE3-domain-containing protein n=1 Tax=Pseudovirgaria hyperparasitica TaxID=470096 RepID=A0A6A6W1S1_9PEZI|nr:STE3-domain-containing protein [Pseudovirgaria hyperparasitica]KAF2755954.1 STE3-domain-containing protein [Pseudovirgaria hyperparasitica]